MSFDSLPRARSRISQEILGDRQRRARLSFRTSSGSSSGQEESGESRLSANAAANADRESESTDSSLPDFESVEEEMEKKTKRKKKRKRKKESAAASDTENSKSNMSERSMTGSSGINLSMSSTSSSLSSKSNSEYKIAISGREKAPPRYAAVMELRNSSPDALRMLAAARNPRASIRLQTPPQLVTPLVGANPSLMFLPLGESVPNASSAHSSVAGAWTQSGITTEDALLEFLCRGLGPRGDGSDGCRGECGSGVCIGGVLWADVSSGTMPPDPHNPSVVSSRSSRSLYFVLTCDWESLDASPDAKFALTAQERLARGNLLLGYKAHMWLLWFAHDDSQEHAATRAAVGMLKISAPGISVSYAPVRPNYNLQDFSITCGADSVVTVRSSGSAQEQPPRKRSGKKFTAAIRAPDLRSCRIWLSFLHCAVQPFSSVKNHHITEVISDSQSEHPYKVYSFSSVRGGIGTQVLSSFASFARNAQLAETVSIHQKQQGNADTTTVHGLHAAMARVGQDVVHGRTLVGLLLVARFNKRKARNAFRKSPAHEARHVLVILPAYSDEIHVIQEPSVEVISDFFEAAHEVVNRENANRTAVSKLLRSENVRDCQRLRTFSLDGAVIARIQSGKRFFGRRHLQPAISQAPSAPAGSISTRSGSVRGWSTRTLSRELVKSASASNVSEFSESRPQTARSVSTSLLPPTHTNTWNPDGKTPANLSTGNWNPEEKKATLPNRFGFVVVASEISSKSLTKKSERTKLTIFNENATERLLWVNSLLSRPNIKKDTVEVPEKYAVSRERAETNLAQHTVGLRSPTASAATAMCWLNPASNSSERVSEDSKLHNVHVVSCDGFGHPKGIFCFLSEDSCSSAISATNGWRSGAAQLLFFRDFSHRLLQLQMQTNRADQAKPARVILQKALDMCEVSVKDAVRQSMMSRGKSFLNTDVPSFACTTAFTYPIGGQRRRLCIVTGGDSNAFCVLLCARGARTEHDRVEPIDHGLVRLDAVFLSDTDILVEDTDLCLMLGSAGVLSQHPQNAILSALAELLPPKRDPTNTQGQVAISLASRTERAVAQMVRSALVHNSEQGKLGQNKHAAYGAVLCVIHDPQAWTQRFGHRRNYTANGSGKRRKNRSKNQLAQTGSVAQPTLSDPGSIPVSATTPLSFAATQSRLSQLAKVSLLTPRAAQVVRSVSEVAGSVTTVSRRQKERPRTDVRLRVHSSAENPKINSSTEQGQVFYQGRLMQLPTLEDGEVEFIPFHFVPSELRSKAVVRGRISARTGKIVDLLQPWFAERPAAREVLVSSFVEEEKAAFFKAQGFVDDIPIWDDSAARSAVHSLLDLLFDKQADLVDCIVKTSVASRGDEAQIDRMVAALVRLFATAGPGAIVPGAVAATWEISRAETANQILRENSIGAKVLTQLSKLDECADFVGSVLESPLEALSLAFEDEIARRGKNANNAAARKSGSSHDVGGPVFPNGSGPASLSQNATASNKQKSTRFSSQRWRRSSKRVIGTSANGESAGTAKFNFLEIDPNRCGGDSFVASRNMHELLRLCDAFLTAIVATINLFPPVLGVPCLVLATAASSKFGSGDGGQEPATLATAGFLFLRVINPVIVRSAPVVLKRLETRFEVQSRPNADSLQRILINVSKVLQHIASGTFFRVTAPPSQSESTDDGAPLLLPDWNLANEFIRNRQPLMQNFLANLPSKFKGDNQRMRVSHMTDRHGGMDDVTYDLRIMLDFICDRSLLFIRTLQTKNSAIALRFATSVAQFLGPESV